MKIVLPLVIAALAILGGTAVDAVVKAAANETSVLSLIAARYVIGGVALGAVLGKTLGRWPTKEEIRFHGFRGVLQTIAAVAFFSSLTMLALAEATAIGMMSVLIVPWFARWILNEPVRPLTFVAALVGFAGVLVAVGKPAAGAPDDTARWVGVLLALTAAVAYALIVVMMRWRSTTESSLRLVCFMNVSCGLLLLPVAIWATTSAPPDFALSMADAPIVLVLAAGGIGVWWLLTFAYARAPAQRVSYFEYTALVWSALLGIAFFDEVPHPTFWLGAGLIVAGCLLVAIDTHRASASPRPSPCD